MTQSPNRQGLCSPVDPGPQYLGDLVLWDPADLGLWDQGIQHCGVLELRGWLIQELLSHPPGVRILVNQPGNPQSLHPARGDHSLQEGLRQSLKPNHPGHSLTELSLPLLSLLGQGLGTCSPREQQGS